MLIDQANEPGFPTLRLRTRQPLQTLPIDAALMFIVIMDYAAQWILCEGAFKEKLGLMRPAYRTVRP